jgi:hypothetical protein
MISLLKNLDAHTLLNKQLTGLFFFLKKKKNIDEF